MNEQDMAKKISQHLNYGTNKLDRSVLARLQAARQQALELHAKPRRAFGLALADSGQRQSPWRGAHYLLSASGCPWRYCWLAC